MAHFIYPNANLYDVLPVGGEQTGGTTNFAINTDPTNESRLTDLSLSTAAGFPANFDAVRFDLSSSGNAIDSIAIHSNGSDTDDVNFYGSDNAGTGVFSSFISGSGFTDEFTAGWTVKAAALSNSTRYVYMRSGGELNIFTEVILGKKLDLTNVNLSGNEGVEYGNDALESYGGVRFSNQRHGARKFFDFNLSFVNETYKTSLETMRDSVKGSHYNLLYYDGSTYHYVKLSDKSLVFKEVAFGVYNTKIELTEQISS